MKKNSGEKEYNIIWIPTPCITLSNVHKKAVFILPIYIKDEEKQQYKGIWRLVFARWYENPVVKPAGPWFLYKMVNQKLLRMNEWPTQKMLYALYILDIDGVKYVNIIEFPASIYIRANFSNQPSHEIAMGWTRAGNYCSNNNILYVQFS